MVKLVFRSKLIILIFLLMPRVWAQNSIQCADIPEIAAQAPSLGIKMKPDFIAVSKKLRKLYLLHRGQVLKSFPSAFGFSPKGHKVRKGDGRTPEGLYYISGKNFRSQYFRSLKISYPNSEDIMRARARGENPGGLVMLHGLPTQAKYLKVASQAHPDFNWTSGCIAVNNREIETIFQTVDVGTPILICP